LKYICADGHSNAVPFRKQKITFGFT